MDVVVIATADWDHPVWTNKQHLAARLAQRHRVLYVESVGLRRPTFSPRDGRRLARRLRRGLHGLRSEAERLWVLSPLLIPGYGTAVTRALDAQALARQLGKAAWILDLSRPVVWSFAPVAPVAVRALHPRRVVYHVADALETIPGVSARGVAALEAAFLPCVDVVITASEALADRWRCRHRQVLYWPNVADVDRIAAAMKGIRSPDPTVARWSSPRAVQVGAVDAYKVDVDLVVALADARPDWQLVMVGPIGLGQPTRLKRLPQRPNLHWVGPVGTSRVPDVLAAADAGLLLHRQNAYTVFSQPMKLREYQAAGLPTVTTLSQWAQEPGVLVGADVEELARALDQARGWAIADRRALARYGARFSWTRRLEEVEELLAGAHCPCDT